MIKARSNFAVALPVVLFVGHYLADLLFDARWALLDAYLDPFCFIPIVFTGWLVEMGVLFGVNRLSGTITLIGGVTLSVFVEEVFPRYGAGFTHDWWDYPLYFAGLAYFWWFINPEDEHQLHT